MATARVILLVFFLGVGGLLAYLGFRPPTVAPLPTPTAKPEMKVWDKQTLAETMLRSSLRDPKSFERIGWKQYKNELAGVTIPPPNEVWGLTYRARNGFGGYDVEEQIYIFGPNGVVPYHDK